MSKLGVRMHLVAFTIQGCIEKPECSVITRRIIKAIGMSPVHYPTTYKYPVDGKGGIGYTYIQPISESFIAWDVWPAIDGAYLVICSCKRVNTSKVIRAVEASGLIIKPQLKTKMGLKDAAKL